MPGHTVLFDPGGDGEALLANMRRLGKDPGNVERVVFSHAHGDHEPLVLTGCSHPGVLAIVDQATRITGRPITRVMGGFHLTDASVPELEELADELRSRGVTQVGPSHCSGMQAAHVFQDAYGPGFIRLGVGRVLRYRQADKVQGTHDPA